MRDIALPILLTQVRHCLHCRILQVSLEELREQFDSEASASAKDPQRFARNFLEYACFKALAVANQGTDPPLRDQGFRRLTYDMMLAWETPKASQKPATKVREKEKFQSRHIQC